MIFSPPLGLKPDKDIFSVPTQPENDFWYQAKITSPKGVILSGIRIDTLTFFSSPFLLMVVKILTTIYLNYDVSCL